MSKELVDVKIGEIDIYSMFNGANAEVLYNRIKTVGPEGTWFKVSRTDPEKRVEAWITRFETDEEEKARNDRHALAKHKAMHARERLAARKLS